MADTINIYRGQDGVIDYETPIVVMALEDTSVEIPNQALPPNTTWHYVRRRVAGDGCEKESPDSPVCIVRINSDGDMLGNIPNAPTNLAAEGLADSKVKLRWRYAPLDEEIAPTGFHIYIDSGEGFDFETPDAEIPYRGGGPKADEFDWTSESLTHGEIYRFCVRSYRIAGGGPELVVNGGFDTDSEWTKELQWSITGGKAVCTGDDQSGQIYQALPLEQDKVYLAQLDLHVISGELGPLSVIVIALGYAGSGKLVEGHNSSSIQYAGGALQVTIASCLENDVVLSIDNVSVVSIGPPAVESQNTNSVSITADSVGPEAITNLIASVEEI